MIAPTSSIWRVSVEMGSEDLLRTMAKVIEPTVYARESKTRWAGSEKVPRWTTTGKFMASEMDALERRGAAEESSKKHHDESKERTERKTQATLVGEDENADKIRD